MRMHHNQKDESMDDIPEARQGSSSQVKGSQCSVNTALATNLHLMKNGPFEYVVLDMR